MHNMSELDLNNKRVLIREDFNVPIENGVITNDRRIQAALPTIQAALKQHAKIILMSHLGRPKEGEFNAEFSLAPVAVRLSELLHRPVTLKRDWLAGVEVAPDEVVLLENVRFNVGEKKNDAALAKKMAALCDVFVMDAFGTAHRAEASTYGVAEYAPVVSAGNLLANELTALSNALANPGRPLLAIVGGAKVTGKLELLAALLNKVDQLIVGGGIANTFIAASGFNVGKSLYEPDLIPAAKKLLQLAKEKGANIPLPKDVVVAKKFAADATATIKSIDQIASDDLILDIGPQTIAEFSQLIKTAKTIIWNGPVGVFEFPAFAAGTAGVAHAIAASDAYSLAGGGDTLAAIDKFQIGDKLSYISTGGGAFLEFVEGKTLPGIAILQQRQ